MGEGKQHQPSMTIEEQVENFKSKNGNYEKVATFKQVEDTFY